MDENRYKNYLLDFVDIQLDKLSQLEKEIPSCTAEEKVYIQGQIMGYYDSLTVLKDQAEAFNIQIPKVQNLDLERYLTLG